MKLRDYMNQAGLSAADFARTIGVKRATVARYATGSRIPELVVMRRIAEATGYQVTANDFFDTHPPAQPRRRSAA